MKLNAGVYCKVVFPSKHFLLLRLEPGGGMKVFHVSIYVTVYSGRTVGGGGAPMVSRTSPPGLLVGAVHDPLITPQRSMEGHGHL